MINEQPPPIEDFAPGGDPQSRWPLVFGIIAIVMGGFTFLASLITPLTLGAAVMQMEAAAEQGVEIPDGFVEKWKSTTLIATCGIAIISALFLAGGVLLVRRKRAAIPVLTAWALIRIVGGGILTYLHVQVDRPYQEIVMGSLQVMGEGAEVMTGFVSTMATVGYIFRFGWLLAVPLVYLIWLNRKKVKEEAAAW